MDDHIIKAAQQAGFRTGNITLSDSEIKPIPFIAPVSATDCQHEVARLYAIAFKAGMERAAEIAKARQSHEISAVAHHAGRWHAAYEHHMTRQAAMADVWDAIRDAAHAQNQPKPIHDSSVM